MPGKMVGKGGARDIGANPVTGYSIIKAASLDEAVVIAEGCPAIPEGGQVAIYELTAM